MAKDDDEKKKYLLYAINNLDIDKAIYEVENMGYEITDDYKNYLRDVVNISKSLFEKHINKYIKDKDSVEIVK